MLYKLKAFTIKCLNDINIYFSYNDISITIEFLIHFVHIIFNYIYQFKHAKLIVGYHFYSFDYIHRAK